MTLAWRTSSQAKKKIIVIKAERIQMTIIFTQIGQKLSSWVKIVAIFNENSWPFVNLLKINHSQLKSACKNVDHQRGVE